ncbi:UNVERIFIED_CONTAM: hypothetical protein PYX00_008577 [Menopon gallinae]|uniref:Peptidase S8 pro-domain domain-containing protein n=1 Tax=Menopon gallinae TaxID=328185 RepID=A0AAW2HPX1_9NEOP
MLRCYILLNAVVFGIFWYNVGVYGRLSSTVYQNQFAVHVPTGNEDADEIASRHGFVNLGKVSRMFYVFFSGQGVPDDISRGCIKKSGNWIFAAAVSKSWKRFLQI